MRNCLKIRILKNGEMHYFLSKVTSKLELADRDYLDEDLMLAEITAALLRMQQNKTPGLDGLPKEYYFTFWDLLKGPLLQVYKEAFVWEHYRHP